MARLIEKDCNKINFNKNLSKAVLPSEMEGATESEKNALKEKEEKKDKPKINSVGFEDLDGTGATQSNLYPEKSKTVFMNLIHVDEQAQVSTIVCLLCIWSFSIIDDDV